MENYNDIPPKKRMTLNILRVLERYSDADHPLRQQDIIAYLKKDFRMDVDRKSIKRNLLELLDMGYDLEYTESVRKGTKIINGKKKQVEHVVYSDWYLVRDFSDAELRLLIDSLLFSKHIPYSQCKRLVEKLKGLSNVYFDKKVRHICNLPENQPENKQLFYVIETLDDAIARGRKVAFIYNAYGADKKLHPRQDAAYVISPYQMVATNGRYYLICNCDKYDDLSNFRVDRITDIHILDEPRKELRKLKAVRGGLNLPKHMAEHVYMFAGESIHAKFKVAPVMIDAVIDWFGKDCTLRPVSESEILVEVVVNRDAFFFWALQYGLGVEVLEPTDMRERLKNAAQEIARKYAKP